MAIDINGLPSPRRTEVPAKQQDPRAVANDSSRQPATVRPQDAVSLTDQAQQLNRLQQGLAQQSPVVDQQRIQALRKAISEGQYKVDPEKLAKAMASLEQALFGDDVEVAAASERK